MAGKNKLSKQERRKAEWEKLRQEGKTYAEIARIEGISSARAYEIRDNFKKEAGEEVKRRKYCGYKIIARSNNEFNLEYEFSTRIEASIFMRSSIRWTSLGIKESIESGKQWRGWYWSKV